MLIGRYGAALAPKRADKNASLGWPFLAALFADLLLVPLDVEEAAPDRAGDGQGVIHSRD